MNGPHDMGGFTRFGAVNPEVNEPVFHAEWERRAFALSVAMGLTGEWNIDTSRHARESIDPLPYWSSSYYEVWTLGLMRLLAETGLATAEEVSAGRTLGRAKPVPRVPKPEDIPDILAKGGPATRPSNLPQRFQLGDKVRALNITPEGHTRLPRYARGRQGEIALVHGTHVWPDSSAHGRGDEPQWLYTVRFSAKELWGKDTRDSVCIDMWEPYLETL